MAEKWIVGVDGGGTKTDFVLCGADGSVAARTLTGGSNVNESGLPAVGALLEEGVFQTFSNSFLIEAVQEG